VNGPEPAGGLATDADLVARLALGEQPALVELYRRHGRRVYPLIRRIVIDESLADEVLQDVFVRLWTRPEQYRPEAGQLLAWLMTVARNLALDALRREKKWRAHADLDDHVHHLTADAPGVDADVAAAVRHAMAMLPADQQRTVELAYFEGLTHAELAARLGEPLGTVKSRLRLALEKLRRGIGRGAHYSGWGTR
jgi:RNA polymerase sigma-70 factor (ECF subfamily)